MGSAMPHSANCLVGAHELLDRVLESFTTRSLGSALALRQPPSLPRRLAALLSASAVTHGVERMAIMNKGRAAMLVTIVALFANACGDLVRLLATRAVTEQQKAASWRPCRALATYSSIGSP